MVLLKKIKDELCRAEFIDEDSRLIEVSAMLRVAGGLKTEDDRFLLEADFESEKISDRFASNVEQLFGFSPRVTKIKTDSLNRTKKYIVKLEHDPLKVARLSGLLTHRGKSIVGLPIAIVNCRSKYVPDALRGAFLARGFISSIERMPSVEVGCDTQQIALAICGLARRMGVVAKTRDIRTQVRATIRETDDVLKFLENTGANLSISAVKELQKEALENRKTITEETLSTNTGGRRFSKTSISTSARTVRAFEILKGVEIPEKLEGAGKLRLANKMASLEELCVISKMQISKDALAGRLKRLLQMADIYAAEKGLPNTYETADMTKS